MEPILAGDIGGTNTRLALYDPQHPHDPLVQERYPSGDYESLWTIVRTFLADHGSGGDLSRPKRAGFGVAGPVHQGVAKLTNLPWIVDGQELGERVELEDVTIVNDFYANCMAVTGLDDSDLHQIGPGERTERGPIAVVGAGTGLGEGFMVWQTDRYVVVPSEGGHTDFAPRNALEIRLLEHLLAKYGRASYERVVTGNGLVNVYEFFRDREGMTESEEVREAMRHEDPAAVISKRAQERSDELCDRSLDLFCAVYGAEAGNLALQVLATGGVYLAGGIAKHVLQRLEAGGFRHAFEQKGRFSEFVRTVPTYVIMHPQPGLMGAALAALRGSENLGG